MRARHLIVVVVAIALTLAACGSSGNKGSAKNSGSGTTLPANTALGQGVTADSVKIGVALPDFDCVKQFVDFIRVGQQQIYQSYIDYLNAHGGVSGRKIVPVFDQFCPIPNVALLAQVCTKFTDDEKVFAVVGNLFDSTGVAQSCVAKQHKTPLMVFDLTQSITDKSPPGMIVFPGTFPERIDGVITTLMQQNHTLDGKKVAVLGEQGTKESITKTIVPDLQKNGVQLGTTAILQIAGTDTPRRSRSSTASSTSGSPKA